MEQHACTRTHITKKATAKKKIENDRCIMEKNKRE
jgi:hypothetical protein